jgi:hypothetical protein
VIAAGGALAGACNAITGLDEDYHVASDARAGGQDASRPDAPTDDVVTPPDGSVPDSSVDASCAAVDAELCLDFEQPDAGASSYLKNNVADASIAVEPGAGMGGTGGLVVSLARGAGGASSSVWFARAMPITKLPREFTHYEVEVDVKAGTTALDYVALAILAFGDDATSNTDYGIALYTDAISKLNGIGDAGAVAAGTAWHHVDLKLERVGDGPSFTRKLTIDGTPIDTSPVTPPATGRSEARLGAFYSSMGGGSLTVTFDRLVVRRW